MPKYKKYNLKTIKKNPFRKPVCAAHRLCARNISNFLFIFSLHFQFPLSINSSFLQTTFANAFLHFSSFDTRILAISKWKTLSYFHTFILKHINTYSYFHQSSRVFVKRIYDCSSRRSWFSHTQSTMVNLWGFLNLPFLFMLLKLLTIFSWCRSLIVICSLYILNLYSFLCSYTFLWLSYLYFCH